MHVVLWSLKRADQCSRALQRKLLNPYGITPARYDLLFVIWQRHKHNRFPFMYQSTIRKKLGVTAPTVCKMVMGLEEQGLITRTRDRNGDRRQVTVTLTKLAFNLLRRIRKKVVKPGKLWLALYTALSSLQNMGALEWYTNMFRRGLEDPAEFLFPDQRERIIGSHSGRVPKPHWPAHDVPY